MEFALASGIGVLVAAGVYLLLRARTFDVILGLTLLSYATNLLIFASGRMVVGKPPVLRALVDPVRANYADPLPQALVLTAIVIAFAMTAVVVVVAMRNHADLRSDHVDGREPERKPLDTGPEDERSRDA
jgi:multicomponent K+:H+ antiporter subunit C